AVRGPCWAAKASTRPGPIKCGSTFAAVAENADVAGPNKALHLTGAAILVSRGMKVLQAAPAGELCRSAIRPGDCGMVPIPYALTYKTTLRGRVPKLVRCEKCSFEYVYLLEMTVAGEGTSLLFLDNEGARQRSAAQAESALQQNLAQGCEVVPCPACGLVQE